MTAKFCVKMFKNQIGRKMKVRDRKNQQIRETGENPLTEDLINVHLLKRLEYQDLNLEIEEKHLELLIKYVQNLQIFQTAN